MYQTSVFQIWPNRSEMPFKTLLKRNKTRDARHLAMAS